MLALAFSSYVLKASTSVHASSSTGRASYLRIGGTLAAVVRSPPACVAQADVTRRASGVVLM